MYTTSLKAKICFAMKCAIATNYLQRNTDKMPDLHAMIFPGSKIAGKRVFQIALSGWGKSVKEGVYRVVGVILTIKTFLKTKNNILLILNID